MSPNRRRTALVTGAASGIGRALSSHLARDGFDVLLVDEDAEAVAAAAAELGATAAVADVADPEAHVRLREAAGVPEVLCLNAGIVSSSAGPVWEAPPEEWHRVLGVNLLGVVHGLRAFVPGMLATGEQHRIVITASLAGLATWPGGGPYAASKHAVVTVAEQAALALRGHPTTVTLSCPALVRTRMSATGDDPADVAAAALAASERGQFLVVPDPWRSAVRDRVTRLLSGRPPEDPVPERG